MKVRGDSTGGTERADVRDKGREGWGGACCREVAKGCVFVGGGSAQSSSLSTRLAVLARFVRVI